MRIVLNPGHDGIRDKGARGPTGLREAVVVREVAQALVGLGDERLSYEPKRQNVLGLWTLTRALRRNPPDILVSLHCDSGNDHLHEARVLRWADDPNRERRAGSEVLAGEIVLQAVLFAENARQMLAPYASAARRGRPFTPGILVNTATRAAVLVELGFLSDRHTEASMKSAWWIARAATALDAGLRSYVKPGAAT